MKTNCLMPGSALNRWKSIGWKVFGIALISLAVGRSKIALAIHFWRIDAAAIYSFRVAE